MMLKNLSPSAPVEVNSTGLVRHEQKLVPPGFLGKRNLQKTRIGGS